MPSGSVKSSFDRARDAFDPQTRADFAQQYFELFYANWHEVARVLRRAAGLFVVLVIGFLLLIHAKNAEFTLGPLKLTGVAAVETLIPAIASYFAYEFAAFAVANDSYAKAAGAIMRAIYPSIYDNDLEIWLAPATVQAWEESNWRFLRTSKKPARVVTCLDAMATMTAGALLVGELIFLAYAYLALYFNKHTNAYLVSASLVIATFNSVRATLELSDSQ